MGRLFGNFFFFIWLGQLTTILGVSTVWILHHNENQRRVGLDNFLTTSVVESAVSTLKFGGTDALRSLLKSKDNFPVYAVDDFGIELLGRPVLSDSIAQARIRIKSNEEIASVKQVLISGKTYLLFIPEGLQPQKIQQGDCFLGFRLLRQQLPV